MEKKSSTRLVVEHPCFVLIPRKTKDDKKISINLNTYRNLHHQENHQCKQIVKENVKKYLEHTGQIDTKFTRPVTVTFKHCKPTKRKSDKSNVFTVATKYIYDALVELEILQDDNDDFIKVETLLETELDRENPRIILTFTEVEG